MKLDYLPKLLLQHDESPYDFENIDVKSLLIQAAEEHNLVYCVHPLG